MNRPLHMLEIYVDVSKLASFLQSHGINTSKDEDLGYGMHAWFQAAFGESAPKPFRVMYQNRCLRTLAYSRHGHASLLEHVQNYADPLAASVLGDKPRVYSKPLTQHFKTGTELGFEVLTCPVTRKESQERDVFLRRVESKRKDAPRLVRQHVYAEWLQTQFRGAAKLLESKVVGFRLVQLLRKTHGTVAGSRVQAHPTSPQALMRGCLSVSDTALFETILHRGIGRHRSFGYGMLLLRPPS